MCSEVVCDATWHKETMFCDVLFTLRSLKIEVIRTITMMSCSEKIQGCFKIAFVNIDGKYVTRPGIGKSMFCVCPIAPYKCSLIECDLK